MFADSFLDCPASERSRQGWSALASFGIQAAVVGAVILLPLIYTSGLPPLTWVAPLFVPSSAPPAASHVRTSNSAENRAHSIPTMVTPQTIPRTIAAGTTKEILSAPDADGLGVSGRSNSVGSGNGVEHGIGSGLDIVAPPPPAPIPHPTRVSRMMEGNLIYRVQPEYPLPAKMARIQGTVLLHALISKQGTIENLQAVGGPPMLIRAAMEAVQQWKYRPYLLNGDPVEVETQITVNFVLGGG